MGLYLKSKRPRENGLEMASIQQMKPYGRSKTKIAGMRFDFKEDPVKEEDIPGGYLQWESCMTGRIKSRNAR